MPAAPPSLGMAGEDLPRAGLERACSCESERKDTEVNEIERINEKGTEINEIE